MIDGDEVDTMQCGWAWNEASDIKAKKGLRDCSGAAASSEVATNPPEPTRAHQEVGTLLFKVAGSVPALQLPSLILHIQV